MTHDQALELLEMFWIRTNGTGLRSYESVKILTGMGLGNNLTIGGQTSDGKMLQRSYDALSGSR